MSKSKKVQTDGGEGLGHQAFAQLSLGDLPAAPSRSAPAKPTPAAGKKPKPLPLVLRREKKGRGGKTVTVLAAPDHSTGPRMEALLQALKKSLGRGGQKEGCTLVLQGEPDDRLRALVEKEGFRLKG